MVPLAKTPGWSKELPGCLRLAASPLERQRLDGKLPRQARFEQPGPLPKFRRHHWLERRPTIAKEGTASDQFPSSSHREATHSKP